jgi:hypothetical protein
MVEEKRITEKHYHLIVLISLLNRVSDEQYADDNFILKTFKNSKKFAVDTIGNSYKSFK